MRNKMTTEQAEIRRLSRIYSNLRPKQRALAEGLIRQAARLRVQLDILNKDIQENGLTEPFQQSDKVDPYDRERPAAALFAKYDKNYQAIINQLNDLVPEEEDGADDLADFRNG